MSDTPANLYPDEHDTTDYQIGRGPAWLIALAFFLTVAAFPLWHHLHEWQHGRGGETPLGQLVRWRPAQGKLLDHIHRTEKQLDQLPYAVGIRTAAQAALTRGAAEGNRKTFLGQDGWMFYQPELTALRGWGPLHRPPFSPMKDPSVSDLWLARDVVVEYAAQLKERGLPLLLVPVPAKAMIYPESLSALAPIPADQPLSHPHQAEFYAALRLAGIDVLDLAPDLWRLKSSGPVFLRQDTHWTPAAMEACAQRVAEHIRQHYPNVAGAAPSPEPLVPSKRDSLGDLEKLLGLASITSSFPPEEAILHPIPAVESNSHSLIALLGDSFVNVFDDPGLGFETDDDLRPIKAGFAQHLSRCLGTTLDVMAVNGGGATATRQTFARRPDAEVRAKKLVIWVLAARDLLLSPTDAREAGVTWEKVSFNMQSMEKDPSTPAGGPVIVEAKLTARSELQDPQRTPYPEALHTAVYEVSRVVSGAFPKAEWVAVQWTYRKRKLEPTATAEVGSWYRLKLQPLASVEAQTKKISTSDDFIDLLSADHWFVESIEEIPAP